MVRVGRSDTTLQSLSNVYEWLVFECRDEYQQVHTCSEYYMHKVASQLTILPDILYKVKSMCRPAMAVRIVYNDYISGSLDKAWHIYSRFDPILSQSAVSTGG